MKPIEFPGQNVIFAKDQPEYLQLPAFRDEKGNVTTVWEFTDEERAMIARGENLTLNLMTFNQPLQPVRPYIEDTGKQNYVKVYETFKADLLGKDAEIHLLKEEAKNLREIFGKDTPSMRDALMGVQKLKIEHKKLTNFAEAHEQWEANFIGTDECWREGGNPKFNNKIYDEFLEIQALRNKALRK